MFVLERNNIQNMMDHLFQNEQFNDCRRSQCSQSGNKEKTWKHMINLTQCPTKPEELHVKMETESKTLSVSGKSEVTKKDAKGFTVFSTHVWSKQVKIPDTIDQSTLSAKMTDNIVTITADYKQEAESKETAEQNIPIEMLD